MAFERLKKGVATALIISVSLYFVIMALGLIQTGQNAIALPGAGRNTLTMAQNTANNTTANAVDAQNTLDPQGITYSPPGRITGAS